MDDETGVGMTHGATRDERRAACLAMLSTFVCAPVGPIVAFVWARRNGGVFVRRYATTNLILDGVLSLLGLAMVPVAVFAPEAATLAVFILLWSVQLACFVGVVVLAVAAWRGRDVGETLLPNVLVGRLPTD